MSTETQAPNRLYHAVWRWHFYAGLYVIPFLLMLAVTGFFMMLFTTYLPEYGDRLTVPAADTALSIEDQGKAALAAVPGATGMVEYIAPYSPTNPALFEVADGADGMIVALNPYTGEILRQTVSGDTWNIFFETIHGTLMIGDLGDRLIEIATSLGVLLVATGLYLVWPRKKGGTRAMFIPDLAAKGRAWWKSLHQTVGTWISLVLVFFLITGLAWAGIWGERFVQAWSTFPAEKWDAVPLSDATHESLNAEGKKEVPWGLEKTPLPQSGSAAGVQLLPEGTVLDLDAMETIARSIGIEGRFRVYVPQEATGVWTISQNSMSYDGASPTLDRTVHVDQFTGKVLADVRYADYGAAAKAMAVGIALHEGQLGLWNFALNALFCLAVVFACVSGLVMWWKRRPSGVRLGAPPRPEVVPYAKGAILITLALSLAFPVLGLTLLAIMALDMLVLSALPPLKRALG
ncbi:MAG: PepSY domain-containing protein [Tabrizicola sp.]|nr:PepSY domain-containing protein [Tabrizicola sp.]